MTGELSRLMTAALMGMLLGSALAWPAARRHYKRLKPLVRHNVRGQRTVEDIAARLELEHAGSHLAPAESWRRFARPAAALDLEPELLPQRPALPSCDPGCWSTASMSQLSFGLG
jgi:hypothetical protein